MARRRFFVGAIRAGVAELRGEDARRLSRVLRVEPGQIFEISDGAAVYLAEILEARGERVVFGALEPVETAAPTVRITLLAALIKFDRFEWMVEKVTELGVERIQPVETARTDSGLAEASRKRRERWARIAREASQQSRRVRAPEILPVTALGAALAAETGWRFVLEEGEAEPLPHAIPDAAERAGSVALAAGPEGGWTDEERRMARAAGWRAVSLGPQILRAETAAIAAIAVLGSVWTA